jgi:hypothetical protein
MKDLTPGTGGASFEELTRDLPLRLRRRSLRPGERLVREGAFLRGPPDLKGQRKILIYICLHSQVGGDLLMSRNLRKMRK